LGYGEKTRHGQTVGWDKDRIKSFMQQFRKHIGEKNNGENSI
jgi:hypothetical protein